MSHWAIKYIGLAYEDVGLCWGLVQACCRERHGVDMPTVQPGAATPQEGSIRLAARACGWRRDIGTPAPKPEQIIVMTGIGGRHVAYATEADGALLVLHATRSVGVEALTWVELVRKGYHSFEFWSRHAR